MKKIVLLIAAVFIGFQSFAQDPELFRTWYLYELQATDLDPVYTISNFDPPIQPFITIFPTLEFSGEGACNSFNGTYTYNNGELISTDLMHTMDDCGIPVQNNFETSFFEFMQFAFYEIIPNSNGLTLRLSNPLQGGAILKDNLLSLENFDALSDFSIFPNPALDVLNISSDVMIGNLAVYSVSGQQLISITGNTNSLDVSSLYEGIYFLEIVSETGRRVEKFIKR